MNNSKIKSFFGLAIAGSLLTACGPDQVGPDYVTAGSDFNEAVTFELFQDGSSIEKDDDLSFELYEDAHFQASFSQEVTWEINVTGYGSSAVKVIKGLSNEITAENSLWKFGRSSNVYFFKVDEFVKAELKIAGLDTVYTIDSINMATVYNWNRKTYNGVKHIVIDNFDSDAPSGSSGLSATSPDSKDEDVSLSVTESRSVEGGVSLHLKGKDANDNGWIGSRNHERLLELYSQPTLSGVPIDSGVSPDDLYFNLYIFGDPEFPKSTIEIKAYELDDTTYKKREDIRVYATDDMGSNTLSSTQKAISDAWLYDIVVNWEGWKLVSVPYSSFRASNNPLIGGNGNRVRESWRITGIELSGLSYPLSGGEVDTYVDYFTITQNGRPQFKK